MPSHPPAPHGKRKKEKEKENPSALNQLALHGGPPFVCSLPTNSLLSHSPRTHGGPSFVRSPHKEPVPTPTSMRSALPLVLPAPSGSACR
ncbi:hypothetical protein BDA96_10G138600 [Sorghum bicolor]|uniref:Uncharacterized protein n=1 Tax=Sorghum bicolor TaxID=4558 RepID=A0A921Q424_SORBI|nr:hypothetical protein BDA96_10G138600 [Sorghum bicolor]